MQTEDRADFPGSSRGWLGEISGSLGDLGTFLPLVLAISAAGEMDLGVVLIWAGLLNVATGLIFRQPIPVQPMKALAAVAVAEELSRGEIAAAGVFTGGALLLLAGCGLIERAVQCVPRSVVRGIQLGIGGKLAWAGVASLAAKPFLGADSIALALIAGALLLLPGIWGRTGLLALVAAGFWIALGPGGDGPSLQPGPLQLSPVRFELLLPTAAEWQGGLIRAAIPQLPLTLLNSVLAVCALSADYFPGRGIPPRRMALSVGLMNLLTVPFGGLPVCHGAGGLAAQHRFGARTGVSVIILGALKIAAGLLLGAGSAALLAAFPGAILGVMLIFAGAALAGAARDASAAGWGWSAPVLIATALPILLFNTTAGFLAGLAAAGAAALIRRNAPAGAST